MSESEYNIIYNNSNERVKVGNSERRGAEDDGAL